MKRGFLFGMFLFAMVPLCRPAYADETVERKVTVYFPLGGDRIESDFRENASALSELTSTLQMMLAPDAPYTLDSVIVEGSASPLGGEKLNRALSRRRSDAMVNYLKENVDVPESLLAVRSTGANWSELREMVEASSMRYKSDVLEVIDRVPVNDRRNYVLMDLKWGRPYREMMETFFPQLQYATTCIIYARFKNEAAQLRVEPLQVATLAAPASLEVPASAVKVRQEGMPLINVSTNLLYWGLLAPNIGIELCAPQNHWSINAEFVQPWWKKDSKHKYYQIRQFSGEARYWLNGDGYYRGHFFGAYGNGGIYDLENGGTGYKGNFWGAGLTYGYVLKLRPRFRMEFSLGVGYLSTKYEQYEPIDNCYVYEKTVRKGYVGPTKAKVGLVWTIVQRKKSGRK